MELVQVGEVVLTGGGDNFTVESTPDSVVTLLNSTPAVADRLTASGSGSAPLQALPSTPLSGGVARASVVTAADLVALFQGVSSVAEAMMAEVTGDPAALVQPAQVYLSGGVEPASTSTLNEVVALLNGTPEVTALFQTTGSGETVVGAGSASLSGGGEQVNLTGTRTYGWDVHGRLAQVSLPGGQVHSYSYDYRTRRIGLQQTAAGAEPAKSTAVVFSGGLSLAEYESTTAQATIASPGQSTVRYVRGPDMGGGVGGLLYSRRAQAVKFNLSNGRGDIVAQSDPSGVLTWTASYEAYGKRTKETGENLDKQRGNSKDEDPTGLLNEGFRYRDLETGVWLSRDPAGFVDGPNVYAYVKQNPWTGFDPDGLFVIALPAIPVLVESAVVTAGVIALAWKTLTIGDKTVPSNHNKTPSDSGRPKELVTTPVAKPESQPGVVPADPKPTSLPGADSSPISKPTSTPGIDANLAAKPTSTPGQQTAKDAKESNEYHSKGSNHLAPDLSAVGDHTTFQRGTNGKVYKYQTYGKTKTGHWNPIIRYDGGKPDGSPGSPHVNKQTGQSIPTPHVQGKGIPGGVRPATSEDKPK